MAWELYAEKNDVSFSPMTLSDESEILNAQFSVMTDRGLPSEPGGYARVTIDHRTPVVLPFYMEDNRSSYYGEFNEQHNPLFVNYPLVAVSLPIAIQQEDCTIMIGAQDNYFAPESYEGNHTIKIEVGSDDSGDEPKRFNPIGVKEAMKHFASTIGSGGIENPANTIKGLTKQILHGVGGFDLQNARTIAEIWTIAGGYEPEPNTPVGVKEAMRYAVSGFGVENPATTIKGLTKQILMVFLNSFGVDQEAIAEIQNARTIAQAWELAAIANGYEPPEPAAKKTNLYLTSLASSNVLNLDTTKSDFATFEEAYDYYDSNSFSDIALYVDDVKFDIDTVMKDPKAQGHEEWGIKGTYGINTSAIVIIHAFGATRNWQDQGAPGR